MNVDCEWLECGLSPETLMEALDAAGIETALDTPSEHDVTGQ